MSKINDGGAAFPESGSRGVASGGEGMSLRDYFAAKAMQGMLACPVQNQNGPDMYAMDAYEIADSMLRARSM